MKLVESGMKMQLLFRQKYPLPCVFPLSFCHSIWNTLFHPCSANGTSTGSHQSKDGGNYGKYDKFRTSGHCTNWPPGISNVTGWGFWGGLHVQFASSIDLLIPSESPPPHLQRKHLPRANQHEALCIFSDVISIPAGGWDRLDIVL